MVPNFYHATDVKMVDGKPSAAMALTVATATESVSIWALAMFVTELAGVDLTLTCVRISSQSKADAS